jgi:hypothetical protein
MRPYVIWGGTNDVRQNETSAGIQALNDLVTLLSHTNVIAKALVITHFHSSTMSLEYV